MRSSVGRKVQLIILFVLVCLVCTMSIAYAVLSTTLNINGSAQVQDASWNVHFDNVQVNPYSVEINPVITDNNKVSFSADLTTPGDFYKFTVDIVNDGSIDAMIESIAKVPELTVEQKKYLRYEVEYVDGTSINDSQLLKSGETKTISILFSYRNDIPTSDLPSTESEFDLEIVLVYVQADSFGVEISGTDSVIKIVSGDLNTVGSEFCIDTECFYLINNDGKNVTLFAKYNLFCGGYSNSDSTWISYDSATGIQDSSMLGVVSENQRRNGTIGFASKNYWSEYINTYPSYVYDSNSNLYTYVNNYKLFLSNIGVNVINARLIKQEELFELGCSNTVYNCKSSLYSWVYSTSYWTGTARDFAYLGAVNSAGVFGYPMFNVNARFGVRPVIEIPISEF